MGSPKMSFRIQKPCLAMHVSVTRGALEWKVSETYARNGQEEEAIGVTTCRNEQLS